MDEIKGIKIQNVLISALPIEQRFTGDGRISLRVERESLRFRQPFTCRNLDGVVCFQHEWRLNPKCRDGWHDVLHPADVEATVKNWKRAIETVETDENEFRLLCNKDRIYRWHRARAMPIRDPGGVISGWSGTNTDIDERMRRSVIESARIARQQTGGFTL